MNQTESSGIAMTNVADPPWKAKWDRVARDAETIWNGACNPRGIARTLVDAIDVGVERRGHSDKPSREDPAFAPARVILAHLCFLLNCAPDSLGGLDLQDMQEQLAMLKKGG